MEKGKGHHDSQTQQIRLSEGWFLQTNHVIKSLVQNHGKASLMAYNRRKFKAKTSESEPTRVQK